MKPKHYGMIAIIILAAVSGALLIINTESREPEVPVVSAEPSIHPVPETVSAIPSATVAVSPVVSVSLV